MQDKEHWKELCSQAAVEQEPEKLMKLVAEITHLLDEKQNRLNLERRTMINLQINAELSRLLAQQTEYFKKSNPPPFDVEKFQRISERIRKLFAELQREKAG